jgi:hypothetical protein
LEIVSHRRPIYLTIGQEVMISIMLPSQPTPHYIVMPSWINYHHGLAKVNERRAIHALGDFEEFLIFS